MGNFNSVYQAISNFTIDIEVIKDQESRITANKVVLPGVGSSNKCMELLNERGLLDLLNIEIIENKKYFLGICVGMQILFDNLYENNKTRGLGWFKGDVTEISSKKNKMIQIPHMGWNDLIISKDKSNILKNIKNKDCYFCHSYMVTNFADSDMDAYIKYEDIIIPSLFSRGKIFGVQFHPEKSHKAGENFIKNFINLEI